MIGRFTRLFRKNGRNRNSGGTALGWLLTVAVAVALINVGCLLWFGNSRAVVPDNNPATVTQLELIDDIEGNEGRAAEWRDDDYDRAGPLQAQMIVRGNGNQDDNRESSFFLRRHAGPVINTECKDSASSFNERRTVAAYRDFGHLKVMPAASFISENSFSAFAERLPMYCGRPFYM